MLTSKTSIFTYSNESKQNVKYLILFLWLSLTVHLYGIWLLNVLSDLVFENSPRMTQIQTKKLHNIILETKTESQTTPNEAAISDKNNMNQSDKSDEMQPEEYNVVNPSPAEAQGNGGQVSYIPQNQTESPKNETQEIQITENGILSKEVEESQKKASEGGGETTPTLYDVNKRPIINLYNKGSASIATQSKEYAQYFIAMQKKIEKYHREFFPVYQYYQGLLKDGEVIVEFILNKEGQIVEAVVASSYGSDTVDNASLNSIVFAKNFGPLPEDLAQQGEVKIRFHFIYIGR